MSCAKCLPLRQPTLITKYRRILSDLMKSVFRLLLVTSVAVLALTPLASFAVSEGDLPGHSLYLHVKEWAAPFPGPGNYTIDFEPAGHAYSIKADGAIPAASGA